MIQYFYFHNCLLKVNKFTVAQTYCRCIVKTSHNHNIRLITFAQLMFKIFVQFMFKTFVKYISDKLLKMYIRNGKSLGCVCLDQIPSNVIWYLPTPQAQQSGIIDTDWLFSDTPTTTRHTHYNTILPLQHVTPTTPRYFYYNTIHPLQHDTPITTRYFHYNTLHPLQHDTPITT